MYGTMNGLDWPVSMVTIVWLLIHI